MKCARDTGFCPSMDARLQDNNAHAKGIAPLVLFNMKTRTNRVAGVVYKKTASDTGLMMNFCPWCGEPVLWIEESKNEIRSEGD